MFVLLYFIAIGAGISKGLMTVGVLSAMAVYVADLNYVVSTLGREFGKTELSGGEWQKLALARCFAFEKDIYLLDEPVSAL